MTENTEECLVHLSVGPCEYKAWLLVLSIPEPYDVLVGDEWLETHKGRLLYDKNTREIITTKKDGFNKNHLYPSTSIIYSVSASTA